MVGLIAAAAVMGPRLLSGATAFPAVGPGARREKA